MKFLVYNNVAERKTAAGSRDYLKSTYFLVVILCIGGDCYLWLAIWLAYFSEKAHFLPYPDKLEHKVLCEKDK
jgi:hypothetical protein